MVVPFGFLGEISNPIARIHFLIVPTLILAIFAFIIWLKSRKTNFKSLRISILLSLITVILLPLSLMGLLLPGTPLMLFIFLIFLGMPLIGIISIIVAIIQLIKSEKNSLVVWSLVYSIIYFTISIIFVIGMMFGG